MLDSELANRHSEGGLRGPAEMTPRWHGTAGAGKVNALGCLFISGRITVEEGTCFDGCWTRGQ
jgi:hypothetical protein